MSHSGKSRLPIHNKLNKKRDYIIKWVLPGKLDCQCRSNLIKKRLHNKMSSSGTGRLPIHIKLNKKRDYIIKWECYNFH
jgi:hypothetical protein